MLLLDDAFIQSEPDQLLAGLHILLLETSPLLYEMLAEYLEYFGATVTVRLRAEEALETFKHTRFDLIISNILMPEKDGYWLIQQIRQFEVEHGVSATPAIALTIAVGESDRQRALNEGFQRHVSKPFAAFELITSLSRLAQKP